MKHIFTKSIFMIIMLVFVANLVAASYTVDETFNGNTNFFVKVYECTTNACTSINPYQTAGPSSSNDITYQGSALSTNPDWYVLYLYSENNCYMPKTKYRYWYGNGYLDYGTSDLTFEKTKKAFCGANVLNVEKNTPDIITAGQTVTVTADIQSAWDLAGTPNFVPEALDSYFNSHVDIYFKVYNDDYSILLYEKHDFVLINFNEWYYPSYSWTPTQPGTYHFEITTNMDNDCKCEGSNTKGGEVTVTIEEPKYCELEISKVDNVDPIEPGDQITYTIKIENIGTADCTGGGVQMWEYYDENTFFIDSTPNPDSGDNYWNFGTIEPGEIEIVTIVVESIDDNIICDTTLLNQIKVWSAERGDQFAEEETDVICPSFCGDGIVQKPNDDGQYEQCDDGNLVNDDDCSNSCNLNYCELELIKTDTPDSVQAGQFLDYTLYLKNIGTKDCTGGGVLLKEYYSADTEFISSNPLPSSGNNLWNFGTVEPGERHVVNIHMKVDENAECGPETYLTNVACVWAAELDDWQCVEEATYVDCIPCVNECDVNERKCDADELWICGYFENDDECTEWGFVENCEFTENSDIYYICENEDSVSYKDVTEGFCNTDTNLCDDSTHTELVDETDCGETQCTTSEFCEDSNTIYERENCDLKGCDEPTGVCYTDESQEETFVKDCSEDTNNEFCDGQNIVHVETSELCVENNNQAQCLPSSSTTILEECGTDLCTEFSDLNPEVFEYVQDDESCEDFEYPYCALDGPTYDFCLTENILEQAYCAGDDHDFQEFNCNDLDGCFEFTYTKCVNCWNPYDARCMGSWCDLIGLEYRDYQCGSGICEFVVSEFIDIDNDMLDDRCDDCIDVDKDGICDDVDNCIGVNNPTQVDTDNDGYGNACDEDRDGDGYSSSVDCDDWNADVHPNAEEIKNNGRDDDCNENTFDKGAYTPRQALYVNIIYDEHQIKPGNNLDILVSVTNNDIRTQKNLRIMEAISGFQERQRGTIQELKSGQTAQRAFTIVLPDNFSDDFEELKISIGNDEYKRIIYRELRLE